MEYSEKTLVAIVQAHPSVVNEIEARDVVFRIEFDAEKLKDVSPWIMLARKVLQQEEFDLWRKLQNKEISEFEAIEKITDLMEQYYGQKYPLR